MVDVDQGKFWSSARDAARFGWWEYMAHDPAWARMTGSEKLAQIVKLTTEYGIDPWTRSEVEVEVEMRTLLADPAFIAKDTTGRTADIDALHKAGTFGINDWTANALKQKLAADIRPRENRAVVADLEKELLADAAYQAADAKTKLAMVLQSQRTKTVAAGDWLVHELYFAFVQSSDPAKPLTAAAELAKVKELMTFLNTKKLADAFGGFQPLTDAALAGMMVETPAYTKANAWARLAMIQEWEKQRMVAPCYTYIAILQPGAGHRFAISSRHSARLTILKAMAKLKATAGNEPRLQHGNGNAFDAGDVLYVQHRFCKSRPAPKLGMIAALQTQGIIDESQCARCKPPWPSACCWPTPCLPKPTRRGRRRSLMVYINRRSSAFLRRGILRIRLPGKAHPAKVPNFTAARLCLKTQS